MDSPEHNVLYNDDINGQEEFNEGSSYRENLGEDAKPSDNVNTTALEWPLRHNNDSETIAFSFNGFRRAKKPRYTYAGRISRVPSRYLDSDSDSSEGSARKAVVSRMKVKRRRKHPRSNKLQVNGFREHNDKFSLLADVHPDRIIYDLNEEKKDSLANFEYPEVFEEVSPTSEDTVSDVRQDKQTKRFFQVTNKLNETIKDRGSLTNVKINGILKSKCGSVFEVDSKTTPECLKSTASCVDISTENKGQPRFDSPTLLTERSSTEPSCDERTSGKGDSKQCTQGHLKRDIADSCNEACFNESCDSSTKATFVSSVQISKQREVSCASLVSNDHEGSFHKGSTCLETAAISSFNNFLPSEIVHGEEAEKELDLVKEAIVSKAYLEKAESFPTKQLVDEQNIETQRKAGNSEFKSTGLNCFRNFKMRKIYVNKLNQKQPRRADRTNGNSGLKKQGLIVQLKRRSVDKVKKAVKLQKKINKLKVNHTKDVQNVKVVKTSPNCQELDRVLGMRRNPQGVYEFLVQWTNGTSCWVSSDQVVTNKHNCILREYLVENNQDISVINRIPFQAYCCDSLSLKECKPTIKPKKVKKMLLAKACPKIGISSEKKEVIVENDGDLCYITLTKETCKRKLTCMRIITEFIAALEDASVSDCQMVVIRGMGSKVFGGLNLEIVCNGEEKGNSNLSKARYLVQTITHYPKPLVALISKPAEGVGALFLSLFDMICDEEMWKKKQVSTSSEGYKDTSLYCLPRVIGHSVPCEEILMGKKTGNVQNMLRTSNTTFPETFLSTSCNSAVVSTLKEIETAMQHLGKKTSSLILNSEDALKIKMNQESVHTGRFTAAGNSIAEQKNKVDTLLNDMPNQDTPVDLHQPTSSDTVDRYVKELESKISEQKQLAQQYFEEISRIWMVDSSVSPCGQYHLNYCTNEENL